MKRSVSRSECACTSLNRVDQNARLRREEGGEWGQTPIFQNNAKSGSDPKGSTRPMTRYLLSVVVFFRGSSLGLTYVIAKGPIPWIWMIVASLVIA